MLLLSQKIVSVKMLTYSKSCDACFRNKILKCGIPDFTTSPSDIQVHNYMTNATSRKPNENE